MPRERFFVEVTPGYVRLRHQLGMRARFGRGPLNGIMAQVVRQLEDLEDEQGAPLVFGPPVPDHWAGIVAE